MDLVRQWVIRSLVMSLSDRTDWEMPPPLLNTLRQPWWHASLWQCYYHENCGCYSWNHRNGREEVMNEGRGGGVIMPFTCLLIGNWAANQRQSFWNYDLGRFFHILILLWTAPFCWFCLFEESFCHTYLFSIKVVL